MMLAALLAAALAAGQTPQDDAPAGARYVANGSEPFWTLIIYDDRITLSGVEEDELAFPTVSPRPIRGIRTWRSRAGGRTISIEARNAPCEDEATQIYADTVRIRVDGRVLNGCGGRLVRGIEE
jgi:uncharacterized membrane protein